MELEVKINYENYRFDDDLVKLDFDVAWLDLIVILWYLCVCVYL